MGHLFLDFVFNRNSIFLHKMINEIYLYVCCHLMQESNSVVLVQLLSHIWLFATPWTAALEASLSFPISWSWLNLMSIELAMPSNHLVFCHFPSPCAFNLPKHQGLFQQVGSLH